MSGIACLQGMLRSIESQSGDKGGGVQSQQRQQPQGPVGGPEGGGVGGPVSHMVIAANVLVAQAGHPPAAHDKRGARLGASWDFEVHLAIDCVGLDGGACTGSNVFDTRHST